MKQKKILLIYPPSNRNYGLYDDLINDSRVIMRCASYRPIRGIFFYLLRKLHLSNIINKYLNLPFKEIWFEFYDIGALLPDIQYILIIDLALSVPCLVDVLSYCRRKVAGMKIGLFYINAIDTANGVSRPKLRKVIEVANTFMWDNIYTFDPGDSIKYDMTYLGFNYYSMHPMVVNHQPQNELYFIGIASQDRKNLFLEIFKRLTQFGCKCDFNIKKTDNNEKETEGINYIERGFLPYITIIKEIQNSKCILEILRENQQGPSLRYFEAVCYNKKLLTNNSSIVNFPYYNENYMKIISKPEDIDIDWLKESVESVDYNYRGDFSPTCLIDYLIDT